MTKRIGITQRVEVIPAYGERRDCLDQSWCSLIEEISLCPVVLPNTLKEIDRYLKAAALDGFILTGGNDIGFLPDAANPAVERDYFERKVLDFAKRNRLPVLGICRGMQMINCYLEGGLSKVEGHIARDHEVMLVSDSGLDMPEKMTVNSFHSWGIKSADLGKNLQLVYTDIDGSVEAFCHKHLPWFGIMWHPERDSPSNEYESRFLKKIFGA